MPAILPLSGDSRQGRCYILCPAACAECRISSIMTSDLEYSESRKAGFWNLPGFLLESQTKNPHSVGREYFGAVLPCGAVRHKI